LLIICICIYWEGGRPIRINTGFKVTIMAVEVKKRKNETTGAMFRRFTRSVQQSGVLLGARKRKSYKPKLTKRSVRERALRKLKILKERERLIKLGKISETERY